MTEDSELIKYLKDNLERNLEPMKASAFFISILSPDCLSGKDPIPALQLGYAMLLDKPIIIAAARGVKVPENLAKVAKFVEPIDIDDPKSKERFLDSLGDFMKKHKETLLASQ